MQSIKNWASVVQQADEDRMSGDMQWVTSPNRSSAAGHARRLDSEDKGPPHHFFDAV